MTRFEEQMKQVHKDGYGDIWPMSDWKIEDYNEMFYYIDKGYIVQSVETNNFVINEEWDDDPLWEE